MIRLNTYQIPSSLAICLFLAGFCAASEAQTPAAPPGAPPPTTVLPPPGASSGTPTDIKKTLSQLADLDLLVAMTPLGFNTTQIDALLAVLESIDKGAADIAQKDDESLRGVASDIEEARTAGLKGTPIDPDTRARIGKVLDEIDKRLKDNRAASIKRVVVVAEQNLTPEQIKLIETQYTKWIGGKIALPAKYRNDPDGRNAYVEELCLTEYIDRILVNDRAIDLLHKLRATAPAPPAPTTAPPPATPPAAPPAPGTNPAP